MFRNGPLGINNSPTSNSWASKAGAQVLTQLRRPFPRRLQKTAIVFIALSFIGNNLQDDGPKRAFQFWKSAFPIYLHYQYANFESRNDPVPVQKEKLNALHEQYAPQVERLVLRLRGFYLKCAQFAGLVNGLPKPYLDICTKMQHQVPSMFIPGDIEFILSKNLKILSPSQVFSSFDQQPLGTASIGEVHLATLRENGDTVAVKLMGFRQEVKFRKDLEQMLIFSKLFFPQFTQSLLEIEAHFDSEFDYSAEARNLLEVGNNLASAFPTSVFVPKPYPRYCTKEVLVMEYVEGPTLIEGIRERFVPLLPSPTPPLEDVGVLEQERRLQRQQQQINAMVGQQVREYFKSRPGVVLSVVEPESLPKTTKTANVNVGKLLDVLCQVHAHEIFVDGAFSSDSHPGNVILMKNNKLGLIDFGQFKRIGLAARLIIARLVVALANGDEQDVVKTLHSAGYVGSPQHCYRVAQVWFDKQTKDVLGGAENAMEFMLQVQRDQHGKGETGGLPEDVLMACRASQMMRSVGSAFGIELSIAKMWEPQARQLLRDNGIHYEPKPTQYKV